jgi:hypothetical protein
VSFYSDLANVAKRLLTDKGQNVTFSREVSSAFDPVTGQNQIAATTFTGNGAAFNYNKSEVDGTIVQNGDIRFLVEATATEPANDDTVTIDNIIYTVMSIKPTSPAGTVVIYELQLRR